MVRSSLDDLNFDKMTFLCKFLVKNVKNARKIVIQETELSGQA